MTIEARDIAVSVECLLLLAVVVNMSFALLAAMRDRLDYASLCLVNLTFSAAAFLLLSIVVR